MHKVSGVYVCVYWAYTCTCVGACVKIRKHFVESVLSYLQVASGSLTQVTRLVQQEPFPAVPTHWPIQETLSEGCTPLKEVMGFLPPPLFFFSPFSGCSKMSCCVLLLLQCTDLSQALYQWMFNCGLKLPKPK